MAENGVERASRRIPMRSMGNEEEAQKNEIAMPRQDENGVALLNTGLTHAWSWFEAHAVQRQNFVNFFLIGVAFLSAAYVGALSRDLHGVAAAVSLIGAAISSAFLLLDLRNRELTRAGERALRDLQARLADALEADSLRMLEAVDPPHRRWISQGKIIRGIHITAIFAFVVAGGYAVLSASS